MKNYLGLFQKLSHSYIFNRKAVKVKVTETHKWHIAGEITDRNPKLGDEKVEGYFNESTDVSQNQSASPSKGGSDQGEETQEIPVAVENTTVEEGHIAVKKEGNVANLFLILGVLFLVLSFAGKILFE